MSIVPQEAVCGRSMLFGASWGGAIGYRLDGYRTAGGCARAMPFGASWGVLLAIVQKVPFQPCP